MSQMSQDFTDAGITTGSGGPGGRRGGDVGSHNSSADYRGAINYTKSYIDPGKKFVKDLFARGSGGTTIINNAGNTINDHSSQSVVDQSVTTNDSSSHNTNIFGDAAARWMPTKSPLGRNVSSASRSSHTSTQSSQSSKCGESEDSTSALSGDAASVRTADTTPPSSPSEADCPSPPSVPPSGSPVGSAGRVAPRDSNGDQTQLEPSNPSGSVRGSHESVALSANTTTTAASSPVPRQSSNLDTSQPGKLQSARNQQTRAASPPTLAERSSNVRPSPYRAQVEDDPDNPDERFPATARPPPVADLGRNRSPADIHAPLPHRPSEDVASAGLNSRFGPRAQPPPPRGEDTRDNESWFSVSIPNSEFPFEAASRASSPGLNAMPFVYEEPLQDIGVAPGPAFPMPQIPGRGSARPNMRYTDHHSFDDCPSAPMHSPLPQHSYSFPVYPTYAQPPRSSSPFEPPMEAPGWRIPSRRNQSSNRSEAWYSSPQMPTPPMPPLHTPQARFADPARQYTDTTPLPASGFTSHPPPLPPRPRLSRPSSPRSHSSARSPPPNPPRRTSERSPPESSEMLFISETVHAAIADILSTTPSLSSIVKSNPIQGRLRVVCLAILHISQSFLTADGTVHGVLGHDITLNNCPPNLRHLMSELGAIGGIVEKMKQEDEDAALALSYSLEDAEQDLGSDDSFELNLESNIERLKKRLIGEAGYRESLTSEPACVRDVEGRIGRLGKHVMSLGSFKEREDIVFEILVGVTS